MIVGTLFESIFDNKTDKGIELPDFEHFEQVLFKLSKVERKDKKDAELMSPAIYTPKTTRANDNVESWGGWCAVDVDDADLTIDLKEYIRSFSESTNVESEIELILKYLTISFGVF